jgi:hypothetical protein
LSGLESRISQEENVMKKILGISALVLVGVLVIGAVAAWVLPTRVEAAYGGGQGRGTSGAGAGAGCIAPVAQPVVVGDLSESEAEALLLALDDEYRAWSVYDQVIADLGAVRPFSSIQRAEESHIAALTTLLERYGVDVPANEWPGNVPTFDSLAEACAAGVQAEIDNAALYDQLLGMVDNPDIVQVFTTLQQASETRHLPAFERCAP